MFVTPVTLPQKPRLSALRRVSEPLRPASAGHNQHHNSSTPPPQLQEKNAQPHDFLAHPAIPTGQDSPGRPAKAWRSRVPAQPRAPSQATPSADDPPRLCVEWCPGNVLGTQRFTEESRGLRRPIMTQGIRRFRRLGPIRGVLPHTVLFLPLAPLRPYSAKSAYPSRRPRPSIRNKCR